jgi:hypothetical protein
MTIVSYVVSFVSSLSTCMGLLLYTLPTMIMSVVVSVKIWNNYHKAIHQRDRKYHFYSYTIGEVLWMYFCAYIPVWNILTCFGPVFGFLGNILNTPLVKREP